MSYRANSFTHFAINGWCGNHKMQGIHSIIYLVLYKIARYFYFIAPVRCEKLPICRNGAYNPAFSLSVISKYAVHTPLAQSMLILQRVFKLSQRALYETNNRYY
jgi:hypothetical protein